MHENYYHKNAYRPLFYDRLNDCPPFNLLATDRYHKAVNTVLRHLPLNLFMCVFIVAIFAFGPGYQPIAFFFMPGILGLVAYTRSAPSATFIPVFVFPAISVGIFFAYAGSFSSVSPWSSPETWYMVPTAFMFSVIICIALSMDRAIADFSLLLLHFLEVFFVFPMIWAGLWTLIASLSPFGDFGNWGFALALMGLDQMTLAVTWLFGAIPGGAYLFGLGVSSTLYLTRRFFEIFYPVDCPPEAEESSRSQKQLLTGRTPWRLVFFHPTAFVVYISALIYGFGTIYTTFGPEAKMFYQEPVGNWAHDRVQMSCLVNGSFDRTEEHLQFTGINSRFVIWSEASGETADEETFLESGKTLSEKYGVYLGLSYKLIFDSDGKYSSRNMFTLIVPPSGDNSSATVGFSYQKSHLVPAVEKGTEPAKSHVPYLDTEFGRVGALIGYDLDFPSVEEAYSHNVDIMFQPTWNWGAIGPLHAQMNRLRAVENGFTLFRCASDGVSGVFDPFYRILVQQLTTHPSDELVYKVPLLGHRWTLYWIIPNYLGIICMAVFVFWAIFLIGMAFLRLYNRYHPRVIREPPGII